MPIFAHLFVGLARYRRCGHQNPELPMANSGDQTRHLSNPNSIWRSLVEPWLITFRFQGKFRDKTQKVSTESVAPSIHAASRNRIDDHSRIMHLESGGEGLESNRCALKMLENCSQDRGLRRVSGRCWLALRMAVVFSEARAFAWPDFTQSRRSAGAELAFATFPAASSDSQRAVITGASNTVNAAR
jgi:hypothetical protein